MTNETNSAYKFSVISRTFVIQEMAKEFQCQPKAQPAKIDLNKKSFPKQKTIQNFTIDVQGFRKTRNENPPTWEIEVTS